MRTWPIHLLLAAGLVASTQPGRAQEDAGPAAGRSPAAEQDAGAIGERDAGAPPSAEVAELRTTASQIDDLLAGSLDLGVDPRALFDISLDDENAIPVEAERLRAIVERADLASAPPVAPAEPAHRPRRAGRRTGTRHAPDAGAADAGAPDAGASGGLARPDPALLAARVDLDRARLAFYRLPRARRESLLAQHAARRAEAAAAMRAAELSQAERRAREAESARREALQAAQRARSEAERIVSEEKARLLAVARSQAEFEGEAVRVRQALERRSEQALAFRRRVRELRGGSPDSSAADALYLELRAFLRPSRDELASALDALSARTDVPHPGADGLSALPVEVDRSPVEGMRRDLQARARQLEETERALREVRARQLHDEVETLNRDRLELLPALSPGSRTAITGFGEAGREQATAELRQVTIILRYHLAAARRWIEGLGRTPDTGASAMTAGLFAVKCALLMVAFLWWRRLAVGVLTRWRERVREADHRRARSVSRSRLDRFLGFVLRVRSPLEWLVFAWTLEWLLPPGAAHTLEVELLTALIDWTLGGALAVSAIDALAAGRGAAGLTQNSSRTAQLRLRSLSLIGRTVVVFGLVLALSSKLVGRGTIHSWVWSTCWFAAIPIVLLIVRWWRSIIFERIGAARRKNRFETWVAAHPSGWKSFPAAIAAGTYLFTQGAIRAVRAWASGFDLTRRTLAYIFRRGLDRIADDGVALTFAPLSPATFAALGPETPSVEAVSGPSGDRLGGLLERPGRVEGGVLAIVGERGSGKTAALARIRDSRPGSVLVHCTRDGLEGIRRTLADRLKARDDLPLEDCARILDAAGRDGTLLIDSAHLLIQPVIGGLADFDRLLGIARRNSHRCTWLLAVDAVVWQFFERARGARPLFDDFVRLEPWREEEIGRLIVLRSRQAGVEPFFDRLIEKLPPGADDIDRSEAAQRTANGYYRLLWDYSAGNPGVALHAWRHSLRIDLEERVCVRPIQTPDLRELEELPDSAVFVLRAVIQLEPAAPAEVEAATMLRSDQVADALRYGLAHSYFERTEERYRVSWTWFRPITLFLQRRHLLVSRW